MNEEAPNKLVPLGDSAILVQFGNCIDIGINKKVLHLSEYLRRNILTGVTDIVPAYSSLSIHYDIVTIKQHWPGCSAYETIALWVQQFSFNEEANVSIGNNLKIPVCYEEQYAPDMSALSDWSGLDAKTIIQLHTSITYHVFMNGFLPGFAYMGTVPDSIAMPRKSSPITNVPRGSLGIAGKQTGIYPVTSPGGWQLIGRTPIELFDPTAGQPSMIKPGDKITFYSITAHEFADHTGRLI